MSSLDELQEIIDRATAKLEEERSKLRAKEDELRTAFESVLEKTKLEVDSEKYREFQEIFPKRPWVVLSKGENRAILACPIYIPLNLGWLIKQDGAYNIFEVNQYTQIFQEVPHEVMDELDFHRPFDGIQVDAGELKILRPDHDDIGRVYQRYKRFLSKPGKGERDNIRVLRGKEFDLIAALIRDGILPFVAKPVDPKDLKDTPSKIKLRDYQQKDYEIWLAKGVIGLMYPMGAGKSFPALKAMDQLKGKKLVLVPGVTQKEQWLEYIERYTDLKPDEYLVEVYHRNTMDRLKDQEFILIIYDEMHRLPANTFLQLATLKSKYRFNLTGTPWREDDRHELVIALHGYPVGVNWNFFLKEGLIKRPTITVHVVRDQAAKFTKLDELLDSAKKTLIFCDRLELGNRIAEIHKIPFVSGDTKTDRLDTIRDHKMVVISRVGDLGVSVKDLQSVIEFDFLYGSRTQEAQRIGRLFHAKEAGEHHLLMTVHEYIRYRKRLWGIESKGFRVQVIKSPDVQEDLAYMMEATLIKDRMPREKTRITIPEPAPKPAKQKPKEEKDTSIAEAVREGKIPFISDIAEPTDELLMKILGCDYARVLGGLRIQDVREILDHFYVKYPKGQWLKDKLTNLYKQHKIQGRRVSKAVRRYFHEDS